MPVECKKSNRETRNLGSIRRSFGSHSPALRPTLQPPSQSHRAKSERYASAIIIPLYIVQIELGPGMPLGVPVHFATYCHQQL